MMYSLDLTPTDRVHHCNARFGSNPRQPLIRCERSKFSLRNCLIKFYLSLDDKENYLPFPSLVKKKSLKVNLLDYYSKLVQRFLLIYWLIFFFIVSALAYDWFLWFL